MLQQPRKMVINTTQPAQTEKSFAQRKQVLVWHNLDINGT